MKLEVGMYVRIDGRKSSSTKYQKFFMIDKIKYIDNCKSKYKYLIREDKDGYCYTVSDEMIVKASYNLLGNDKEPCLIEVGDYVNGYKVLYQGSHYSYFDTDTCDWIYIKQDEQIKSIVTKEQFSQMEYKVGDE